MGQRFLVIRWQPWCPFLNPICAEQALLTGRATAVKVVVTTAARRAGGHLSPSVGLPFTAIDRQLWQEQQEDTACVVLGLRMGGVLLVEPAGVW